MPVVDFVGMTAMDADGNTLGVIEKIARFGEFEGITATKAESVVMIGGKAHRAGDVRVAVEVE